MDNFYKSAFKCVRVVIYTLFVIIATLIIDGWISKPQIKYIEVPMQTTSTDIKTATKTVKLKDGNDVVDITPYSVSKEIIYTVQEGDSFWELAERFYNDGNKYTVIMIENNIESLMPGDEIHIPIFEPTAEICFN